ncbi:hybrid sensor histidine kinase/response regulator [Candidatus Entotheonella palauensis]|uniref:hybrid sensor histidine kinase/response regulator n=1 Tax=Candidatus Entotheonella palauensis TaxID=93172 RepID=UPI001177AD9E|nr:ATP-binding protein [Candidatus Entotheonella palauensis]
MADGGLTPSWSTLFNTLLDYWEQGHEEQLCTWASQYAQERFEAGEAASEMLHILHHVTSSLRTYLATCFWRQGPFLQALDHLEEGMQLLRRQYLEAYETLAQAQHQQFQEGVSAMVEADMPEEMLKRLVTIVQALSDARYVALHVTVETSAISPFVAKDGAGAEAVTGDEPPAWCEALATHLDRGQAVRFDDPGSLRRDLTLDDAWDGECIGVTLRSVRGVLGHLFLVSQHPSVDRLKRIEALAVYAGTTLHASLMQADMRSRINRLNTTSHQASRDVRQLRTRLRETQQRLENLVQHLPQGIMMLDTAFHVVMANPLGQDYLAVLAGIGAGERLTALGVYPIELLLLVPEQGHHHEIESQETPPRVFEVEVNTLQSQGEADGWLLVLHEVTEKRQVRQQLLQKEHLANMGQGVAGMAHDFNNLLSGTISLARSLEVLDGMPSVAQDRLARIVELGKHGSNLVRQMIDVTPSPTNTAQPLNVDVFLSETCEMLKHVIPKQVYFFLASDAGQHVARINAAPLQQALMNLVVNAIDAMPQGGKLRLGLSRTICFAGEPPPCPDMPLGEWVVLTLTDTGSGIPADVLPHVLESFFTTKPPGKGTGLGLSQVHGIVKQHQGYMNIESQEGEGTSVFIYLPAVDDVTAGLGAEMEEDLPQGQGEVVLLVDDEIIVREGSKALLEYLGYQVLTADNGLHALDVYRAHQHEIALVLTDMVMPEIDGVKLFHQLRQLNPEVMSVLMTGYPLGEERQQLLQQGIADWLQKPLDLAVLAQTVNRILAR